MWKNSHMKRKFDEKKICEGYGDNIVRLGSNSKDVYEHL